MGDAPLIQLVDLQGLVRYRMNVSPDLNQGIDEVVNTTLRWWPQREMARLAVRQNVRDNRALDALSVVAAKVREDLEFRWGVDAVTARALDRLVQPVVLEVASFWFASVEARIGMRACIVEVGRRKP